MEKGRKGEKRGEKGTVPNRILGGCPHTFFDNLMPKTLMITGYFEKRSQLFYNKPVPIFPEK
ncbi:MAG: hypothetical protein DDT41_00522 [candidate division WS2 bacterium]|nr:hypothetical protein [Candidatus Psychracetigena formicireducens]